MVSENIAFSNSFRPSELAAVIDFDGDIISFRKEINQFIFLPVFKVKTICPLQFFYSFDVFNLSDSRFQLFNITGAALWVFGLVVAGDRKSVV